MLYNHPKFKEEALEFKHLNHFKNHVESVHEGREGGKGSSSRGQTKHWIGYILIYMMTVCLVLGCLAKNRGSAACREPASNRIET